MYFVNTGYNSLYCALYPIEENNMSEKDYLLPAEDFFNFSKIFFNIENTENTIDLNIVGYMPTSTGLAKKNNAQEMEDFRNHINIERKVVNQEQIRKAKETKVYDRYFSRKNNKELNEKTEKFLSIIHKCYPDNSNQPHRIDKELEIKAFLIFAELSYYYGHYANNVNAKPIKNIKPSTKKLATPEYTEVSNHKSKWKDEEKYLENLKKTLNDLNSLKADSRYKKYGFSGIYIPYSISTEKGEDILVTIEKEISKLGAIKRSDKTTADRKLIIRIGHLLFQHRDPNDEHGEYKDLLKLEYRVFIKSICTKILNVTLSDNAYQEALDKLKDTYKDTYKKEPNLTNNLVFDDDEFSKDFYNF